MVVSPFGLALLSRKDIKRNALYYLAGLVIPLMIIFYFKSIAPKNDLLNSENDILAKIMDISRYRMIASALINFFGRVDILLLVVAVVFVNRVTRDAKTGLWAITILLALQLLGYCAVYLITPNDLGWHLITLPRLMLQITPLGLFLCFNIISEPEFIFS